MAVSYDHIVHIRGISAETIKTLNDRDSLEALIDSGSFNEVKTVPGISIYINQSIIKDPQSAMIALKNGNIIFQMSSLPQD